ncbi:MAG: FGGY family carbohydrate kinase, partial [Clostridiales bacterium]|nr:FGGY family carbohydrate kinase [Clostridiales bacterium]
MALIGLDIGTTGCKCTIFDTEGNICSYAYKEYKVITPSPGFFELNPEEVWEAVKFVIGTSVKKYTGEKITALSISSLGEAAIPVDKYGKTLYNSLL